MAFNLDTHGTQAQVLAAAALITGDGSAEENTNVPDVITEIENGINQFFTEHAPAHLHVVAQGSMNKTCWRMNMKFETVHLDPDGNIVADCYPQIV